MCVLYINVYVYNKFRLVDWMPAEQKLLLYNIEQKKHYIHYTNILFYSISIHGYNI